jgi:hypothetical protein
VILARAVDAGLELLVFADIDPARLQRPGFSLRDLKPMGRWTTRPYFWLLTALIGLTISHTFLKRLTGSQLPFYILLTAVYVSAFFAVCRNRFAILVGLVLLIPALLGTWVRYATLGIQHPYLNAGFHLFAALSFAYLAIVILRASYRQVIVTADGLVGAFCAYFLVGVVFGHLYCACDTLAPGSFAGNKELSDALVEDDRRHFLLTYFSFITLTTVGYGDITPCQDVTRTMAAVEALTGQFYLAILISEFVRKRGDLEESPRPPSS